MSGAPEVDEPPDVWARLSELRAQAITALTEAAQLTRPCTITQGGRQVERQEPIDFAELATQVLASVAANRGGVGTLLAGRPGSWEADGVRSLLHSTVGYDEQFLMEHRTIPVVVELNVDDVLQTAGQVEEYTPDDPSQVIAETAKQAGISVQEATARHSGVFRRWVPLVPPGGRYDDELEAVYERENAAYEQLGEQSLDDDAYTAAADAIGETVAREEAAVAKKWRARFQRYAAAFDAAVRAKAAADGIRVPVEVRADTEPASAGIIVNSTWEQDPVAARLWEHAWATVPQSLLITDD